MLRQFSAFWVDWMAKTHRQSSNYALTDNSRQGNNLLDRSNLSISPHRVDRQINRRLITTVQGLLGHKDVKTTMIHTHVLNRGGLGVRSPLDG